MSAARPRAARRNSGLVNRNELAPAAYGRAIRLRGLLGSAPGLRLGSGAAEQERHPYPAFCTGAGSTS
ncbi:MAG: hypothetical protein OEW17_11260, partial [Gemmatimonadota bacterium]|nr:hypothetical protein [Gemmatimonadota bacterium]